MPETVLRTPLHASHVALGGRMVEFAGYDMPVQYSGIIAETKAVREGAGMFDVSHMARLWFRGERTLEFLEWITTNDVSKLEDGRGQYSMLPNPNGGIVDDIIVYRVGQTTFRMVVNAANHAKDVAWMKQQNQAAGFGVEIADETDATAMIAVQGPKAAQIVAGLSDHPQALLDAPLFGLNEANIAGVPCFAPRSGYTGEDGFELICPTDRAVELWDALLAAGVVPCGLGSRDALRVEAGLPLYGHELSDTLSPIAAGLGWVISKTKPFIGSEFINKARTEGVPRKIHGVKLASKRLLTPGMSVYGATAESGMSNGGPEQHPAPDTRHPRLIGEVTSGVYSPTLECSIAFALIDASIPLGTPCSIEIRGAMEPGEVVNKRFLKA